MHFSLEAIKQKSLGLLL